METPRPFVLFDDAIAHRATLLHGYAGERAIGAAQLHTLDAVLREGWARQHYAAVLIPYEFGDDLINDSRTGAALRVHWFKHRQTLTGDAIDQWLEDHAERQDPAAQPAGICGLRLTLEATAYAEQFKRLQEAIARGDIYQINFTASQTFETYGSPLRLYRLLRARQPVPYGSLAALPRAVTLDWTLCLSPELFLRIDPEGVIHTEPMKGTLPFQEGDDLAARSDDLRSDAKNRAENLMIVDLLRNDLSRIAVPGGVRVEELFRVTRFDQVLQMTTPIQCRARPGTTVADMLGALFPCGSITGAPKKMSMRYIADSESRPRGIYTGSLGYLEPQETGLGFSGCFNVAIRSLTLRPKRQDALACDGSMGVGGGIVYDSTAASEYEELHWKSRFLRSLPMPFSLFETMRIEGGDCALFAGHMARLQHAATALGFHCDPQRVADQLRQAIAALPPATTWRMKAILSADGQCRIEHAALPPPTTPGATVSIASRILPVDDPLRRFKTTWRAHYDDDLAAAMVSGHFDTLYFNQDGHLLEGARSSVFIRHQGVWLTPDLSLDILRSVMRAQVLAAPRRYLQADRIMFAPITRAMLRQADRIVLCNALRGCIEATLATA